MAASPAPVARGERCERGGAILIYEPGPARSCHVRRKRQQLRSNGSNRL